MPPSQRCIRGRVWLSKGVGPRTDRDILHSNDGPSCKLQTSHPRMRSVPTTKETRRTIRQHPRGSTSTDKGSVKGDISPGPTPDKTRSLWISVMSLVLASSTLYNGRCLPPLPSRRPFRQTLISFTFFVLFDLLTRSLPSCPWRPGHRPHPSPTPPSSFTSTTLGT